MWRKCGGRLFQVDGAATEIARSPSLVLARTVAAVLVVAERRWRLVGSSLTNSTRPRRYGGQFWWNILCMRVATLKVHTLTDRKPVKFFQCWSDVSPAVQSKNKTRSGILYTLQRCKVQLSSSSSSSLLFRCINADLLDNCAVYKTLT